MHRIFTATVQDGKLLIDSLTDWYVHLRRLNYKKVEVIVREPKKIRSVAANNYYHGVVVKIFSDATGYDTKEAHAILKWMFLPHGITSTTNLSTVEMETYLSAIRQWLSLPKEQGGWGLYVPTPNEVMF